MSHCGDLFYVSLTHSYVRCDALPTDLDGSGSHQRSHVKTDLLIKTFDLSVLWDDFGLRHNIVVRFTFFAPTLCLKNIWRPFTYSFPRADIHELLAPDLLHQLIKGVFKDHLVEWVLEYLHLEHGEKRALEIIEDVDRRCGLFFFLLLGLIKRLILASQLSLRSLLFVGSEMGVIISSGQVTIQRL